MKSAVQRQHKNFVGFTHKVQHGTFVSEGIVEGKEDLSELVRAPVAKIIERIRENLRILDPAGGTAALIFDYAITPDHTLYFCSYLVTLHGPVLTGRAESFHDRPVSIVSREILGVDAAAVRRLINPFANQPKRSGQCQSPSPIFVGSWVRAELQHRLAAVLLPHDIEAEIRLGRLKRLLILPAADIGNVPIAALPVAAGGRPLVEFVAPVVLPDLDALMTIPRRRVRPMHALVVGDPDGSLPAAKDEAGYVASLLPASTVLLGEAATLGKVLEAVRPHSLIYLATHGISHPEHPMDGGFLVLSNNEVLTGEAVKGLSARDSLVVMSACQTGLGKVFGGGVFGLASAWRHAGASQLIMSLWDVDDCATASIMKTFARLTISEGMPPEYALRAAMLEGKSLYEHPSLWASLVMFGSPTPAPGSN